MVPAADIAPGGAPHIPVLLDEVLEAAAPVQGAHVIDATFGAGGYARAFLDAGAAGVIGIDRDPSALVAADWAAGEPRLVLAEGVFGDLDQIATEHGDGSADIIVLDIGVSSMQLDQDARGFSFQRDGPLDMRMSGEGVSAADLVNTAPEGVLADILYQFGEERASRRIARAIVEARKDAPLTSTLQLAEIVIKCLGPPRPGQVHPATRTFQALRIAVNDELGELVRGLAASERCLKAGGRLAVVTFHSLEDRIVKRFFQEVSAITGGGSRHQPAQMPPAPRFERPRKAVAPGEAETARNPRARSARLRSAIRTDTPPIALDPRVLGLPKAPVADDLGRGRRG